MKQNNTIWNVLLASACSLLLYACAGGQEELERLNAAPQDTDSRTVETVTADITLTEAGTLDAKLSEKLGSNKPNVQVLSIAGPFNARDVECLHTLTALEKLEMTDAETKWDYDRPYYTFSYSYEDSYGNIQEVNVSEHLSDNGIGNYMFAGMPALKEIEIPSTITSFAFYNICHGSPVTTITVPEGVTRISGFNNCRTLTTVHLPSTLKEIGSEAFRGSASLKSLTIPEGVEYIESQAFAESGLTEIVIPASCTRLGYGVFNSCKQLQTLTIPKTVSQTDGSPVDGCENLRMLAWNTTIAVPGSRPTENCFLYINSDNGTAATYDANSWPNTIVDGIAESIQMTYSNSTWGTPKKFSCPIAFTAKSISLTMTFLDRWTYEGKASGWRTLTLPFKVSSITSEEKGALAPFGSDVEGAKPFWLRKLTADGFVDATSIEADKPYIIAMPYNPGVYLDEYNISGNVTFTGENVEIAVTPDELPADEGPDYLLQPTYQFVKRGGMVYALNYDYSIRNHELGSVFARSSTHVYAYEAYVKDKNGSSTRALYEIDTRSPKTRSAAQKNTTGIPAIGDM